MRVRYASFALAFLAVLGAGAAVAVAVRTNAGPQPPETAAPAAATATAVATSAAAATPAPLPTATAAAAATPTPTATAAAVATPSPKRYDRLDATGAVATAGSWAILGADGGVLTAWEDLRGSAATLRVHENDASGVSRAEDWGEVGEGGVIEWRKADDCWVRYRVAGAPARPAPGAPHWEFPIEWGAYAATGAGCTGAVGASTGFSADGNPLPITSHAAGTPSIVAGTPVRFGPYLMYRSDWTGALEAPVRVSGPAGAREQAAPTYTTDPAEARRHPLWRRDPAVPSGWVLLYMSAVGLEGSADGFTAVYGTARGYLAAYIYVSRYDRLPIHKRAYGGSDVLELRTIDGHPAVSQYSRNTARVRIFDETTDTEHFVIGAHSSLRSSIDATIEIARSLYRAPQQ